MHVKQSKLMVFEQNLYTSLEENYPFHQETDIELFLDLVAALIVFLHQFPIRGEANSF